MADWARAQSPGAVEEILDRENKRMADNLASKVTRLKSLALDIDRDAEDQNRYLDGMDSDFTSMTGLLTGSVKRFSTMARSGRDNRKLLCGRAKHLPSVFWRWCHGRTAVSTPRLRTQLLQGPCFVHLIFNPPGFPFQITKMLFQVKTKKFTSPCLKYVGRHGKPPFVWFH
ncbi:BET1-like protein isoform X1 [Camelus dromedarius]|uniref:BET1-like protein isoform X1 n=1 Tax=Camelus dromedarius TaxID=9838 RepID=UPI0031192581